MDAYLLSLDFAALSRLRGLAGAANREDALAQARERIDALPPHSPTLYRFDGTPADSPTVARWRAVFAELVVVPEAVVQSAIVPLRVQSRVPLADCVGWWHDTLTAHAAEHDGPDCWLHQGGGHLARRLHEGEQQTGDHGRAATLACPVLTFDRGVSRADRAHAAALLRLLFVGDVELALGATPALDPHGWPDLRAAGLTAVVIAEDVPPPPVRDLVV